MTYWLGLGPGATVADIDVDPATNTVGDKMMAMMEATYAEGNTRDPAMLKPFIAQGRKMILYHGASDPSIPASQSIAFYRELAGQQQGIERTQQNVRLFLVPGMHHCSGGPAPDRFDTLSALEAWVEHGKAPEVIQASTRPESPVQHRLPLCPYPQQARYRGTGEITDPSNWQLRGGDGRVARLPIRARACSDQRSCRSAGFPARSCRRINDKDAGLEVRAPTRHGAVLSGYVRDGAVKSGNR